jgi:hypothetical protein
MCVCARARVFMHLLQACAYTRMCVCTLYNIGSSTFIVQVNAHVFVLYYHVAQQNGCVCVCARATEYSTSWFHDNIIYTLCDP